jgi:hypothetical protein
LVLRNANCPKPRFAGKLRGCARLEVVGANDLMLDS